MAKKYDVVATLGSYERDGQKKYITRNVGSVIQTQKGFRLALDASFSPAGCRIEEDGKVWLALFEPRPRQEGSGHNDGTYGPAGQTNQNSVSYGQGGSAPMDDEVPFAPEWRG